MNTPLLRGAMAEAGMTQKALAKAIGIGRSTLSLKINGSRDFNLGEIVAICDALKITDNDLKVRIFLT